MIRNCQTVVQNTYTALITISGSTVPLNCDYSLHYFREGDESVVLQTRPLYKPYHFTCQVRLFLNHWQKQWQNGNWRGAPAHFLLQKQKKPNMANAVNVTGGLGPQIGCFVHTVNLADKSAVSINQVSRLLEKVRKATTLFRQNTTAA